MNSEEELPQTIRNIRDQKLMKAAAMHFRLTKAAIKEKNLRIQVLNLIRDRLEFIFNYLKSNHSLTSKRNLFDLYYHDADVQNFLNQNARFKSLKKETIQVALVQSDIKSLNEQISFFENIIRDLEVVHQKFTGCQLYSSRDPYDCFDLASGNFAQMLGRYNHLCNPPLSLPPLVRSHFFNQAIHDLQTALMRDLIVHFNNQFQLNRHDEINPLPTWIVDLTEKNSIQVEVLVGVPEKPMRVTPTQVTPTKKNRRKFEPSEKKLPSTEISSQQGSLQKRTLSGNWKSQSQEPLMLSETSQMEGSQDSQHAVSQDSPGGDEDAFFYDELPLEDYFQELDATEKHPSDDLYLEDLSEEELKKRMQACSTQHESKTATQKQKKKSGSRRLHRFEKAKREDCFEASVPSGKQKKKGLPKEIQEYSESQTLKLVRAKAPTPAPILTSPTGVSEDSIKAIYLTERSMDTFERMTQSHYAEKVTILEYVNLLRDFIELNSKGFLKKVVQLKTSRGSSDVSFNLGEGESFLFISREGQEVYFSFHYPHDRDGNNHRKVPKEYRDEYMRVFKVFQIQFSDLIPVRRLNPERG